MLAILLAGFIRSNLSSIAPNPPIKSYMYQNQLDTISYFPIVQNMLDSFEMTDKGHQYYFVLQSFLNFNYFPYGYFY